MQERVLGERTVLDHGLVRLLDPFMGSDLSIVRAARVSYDAAWRAGDEEDKDLKLMRRLWSGKPSSYTGPLPELPKHSTPFESCCMTFEVMAPIFVFRQWHRHRTQSYNELSARYRELPETYYIPSIEIVGKQSANNKQGRENETNMDTVMRRAQQISRQAEHTAKGFELYRELLADGWPKELARVHLGVGVYSHMFATMNLLNFFKFANLRADPHAQYEIRVYAEAMVDMVADICPVAVALFREANDIPEF
jgi:thymidylate synthase (FAD)